MAPHVCTATHIGDTRPAIPDIDDDWTGFDSYETQIFSKVMSTEARSESLVDILVVVVKNLKYMLLATIL
jgi:hypothetical protein